MARDAASAFNPDVRIVAHHANIKSHQFDVAYYASFDVVLSALDNLDTRRWVNRMCVMARVPLIVERAAGGFWGGGAARAWRGARHGGLFGTGPAYPTFVYRVL